MAEFQPQHQILLAHAAKDVTVPDHHFSHAFSEKDGHGVRVGDELGAPHLRANKAFLGASGVTTEGPNDAAMSAG